MLKCIILLVYLISNRPVWSSPAYCSTYYAMHDCVEYRYKILISSQFPIQSHS